MERRIIQVSRVAKRCSVSTVGSYCAYSGSSLAGVIGLKLADNVDNNSREIIFTFVREICDPDCSFLGLNSSFKQKHSLYFLKHIEWNASSITPIMTRFCCHDERCGTFRTTHSDKSCRYAYAEKMHIQINMQD